MNHLTSRAQRLVEEFNEGLTAGGHTHHGIARVLTHLADCYTDDESWYAIPASTLVQVAAELTAPALLARALAGDADAARQFLMEEGFITADGQLAPQYRPLEEQP